MIGAGVSGLSAAIRLAERGVDVEIFEAAPKAGGRTRSFTEPKTDCLCDNGPHLLIGAYQRTQQLLEDCHAGHYIAWQPSLELPLWDKQRGFFTFKPSAWLPFQLAVLLEAGNLPGHDQSSSKALLRMAGSLKSDIAAEMDVKTWAAQLAMPDRLIRDFIEPLCLGAMNEGIETACASSFWRVLHESFGNRAQARLGWFRQPLDEALIQPLCKKAEELGVKLHIRSRIRALEYDESAVRINGKPFHQAILALPAHATDRLLGVTGQVQTHAITNIHLWFEQDVGLPSLFVGGIGTTGQWFFDISRQMNRDSSLYHLCAVISANDCAMDDLKLVQLIMADIRAISGNAALKPVHYRIIREKRATVLVRHNQEQPDTHETLFDASERPSAGDLPATIESAVQRGEKAASSCLNAIN